MVSFWKSLFCSTSIAVIVCAGLIVLIMLFDSSGRPSSGFYNLIASAYSCFVTVICSGILLWKIDNKNEKNSSDK